MRELLILGLIIAAILGGVVAVYHYTHADHIETVNGPQR